MRLDNLCVKSAEINGRINLVVIEYGAHFFIIDARFDYQTSIIFYNNPVTFERKCTEQFSTILSSSYTLLSNDSGVIATELSIPVDIDPAIETITEIEMMQLYKEKVADWVAQEAIEATCNAP